MEDSIFPQIRKFCAVNKYSSLGSIFSILNNDKINLHTVLTKSKDIHACLSVKRVKALPKAYCTIDFRKTMSTFESNKPMLYKQLPKYSTNNDLDQTDRSQFAQLRLKQHRISLPSVKEIKQLHINKCKKQNLKLSKQKKIFRKSNNISHDIEYSHTESFGRDLTALESIIGKSISKPVIPNDIQGKVSIAVGMA